MTELHWLSVSQASRAIAARELSPVALVEALLARIASVDPVVHAFIHLDAQAALAAARVAEAEAKAGRLRGRLHGIPIGVKDIIDVAQLPTTCSSRILKDHIAATDAACVASMRDAGALVLGKLSTYEFATGAGGEDLPWPPARNPWNPAHHPGGSSSGSGAAVAAGLLPLALGTDTGGSIRHPSGACGIVGMKPTCGLVPRQGVFPLSPPMDTAGPMTRTVEDNALVLDVMVGHDRLGSGGAAHRPSPRSGAYLASLELGARGLRIGFVRHFHETDLVADPQVSAALNDVARALEAEGAIVRDVQLPPLQDMSAAAMVLLYSHAWAIHATWLAERPADYGQIARRRLAVGAFLDAADVVRAYAMRQRAIEAVQAVFAEVDVLLCANSMDPPCRADRPEELQRTQPRQARTPFSLTGHPALGMMAGLSTEGLPLSMQWVGRYFDEATVYRTARAWERLSSVAQRHPPLAA